MEQNDTTSLKEAIAAVIQMNKVFQGHNQNFNHKSHPTDQPPGSSPRKHAVPLFAHYPGDGVSIDYTGTSSPSRNTTSELNRTNSKGFGR